MSHVHHLLEHPFARILVLSLLASAITFVLLADPNAQQIPQPPSTPPDSSMTDAIRAEPKPWRTIPLQKRPRTSTFRLGGILQAHQRADLSFVLDGRLLTRPIDVGDVVRKGQLLAKIDPQPYRHQVRTTRSELDRVRAQLEQAGREQSRSQELYAQKVLPLQAAEQNRTAYDALKAKLNALQAQLSEAERQLRESELRAPFAGTVTQVHVQPRESLAAGQPVVSISNPDLLSLEVEIPEQYVAQVQVGQSVMVQSSLAHPLRYLATVVSTSRAANTRRMFPARIELALDSEVGSKSPLLAGMSVYAVFEIDTPASFAVPTSAVLAPTGAQPYVVVERAEATTRVPVQLGRYTQDVITVDGNFVHGDRVLVSGHNHTLRHKTAPHHASE